MTNQNEYLKSTKLITAHYGEEYEHYYNAIVPPVFMNSLNVFETLEDYYDFDRTDKHKYCYGRVQNPTVRILEDKIAALEHGVGAWLLRPVWRQPPRQFLQPARQAAMWYAFTMHTAVKGLPQQILYGALGHYPYVCDRRQGGGI